MNNSIIKDRNGAYLTVHKPRGGSVQVSPFKIYTRLALLQRFSNVLLDQDTLLCPM